MFLRVLSFIRLPLLVILIFAIARFTLGLRGVPYAPRGNAMFSISGVTLVSCFYFGALSKRVGNFGWAGTALIGLLLGLFSQLLIFTATWVSYTANLNTYFLHWDALNIPEGTTLTMAEALGRRAGGLVTGPFITMLIAMIGRLLGILAPDPSKR